MNNKFVASIAAIPLAVAGVFAGAGAANAAALMGEFQLSSGQLIPGGISNIFLTKNSLYFEPTPTPVVVDADTNGGTFASFNSAYISQIITFDPFQAANPFLDLGFLTTFGTPSPGTIVSPFTDDSSLKDGLNVFNLTKSSYRLSQSGANVSIDVDLWGDFVSETGEVTMGAGNLTFQVNNATVAGVQGQLDDGQTVGDMTFSGGLFSSKSVPEPTTLFGLGVVTAGLVASRRKKGS